jgi:large subunit ribosomal protein L29
LPDANEILFNAAGAHGAAMKMKEIIEKETGHLEHELIEKRKHLFELRSQAVTEKLEDPSQLGKARRDIARIKTALRQRVLEQQKTQAK